MNPKVVRFRYQNIIALYSVFTEIHHYWMVNRFCLEQVRVTYYDSKELHVAFRVFNSKAKVSLYNATSCRLDNATQLVDGHDRTRSPTTVESKATSHPTVAQSSRGRCHSDMCDMCGA